MHVTGRKIPEEGNPMQYLHGNGSWEFATFFLLAIRDAPSSAAARMVLRFVDLRSGTQLPPVRPLESVKRTGNRSSAVLSPAASM